MSPPLKLFFTCSVTKWLIDKEQYLGRLQMEAIRTIYLQKSVWLLTFRSLNFEVLEIIITLREITLEVQVNGEKPVDCGNMFPDILKLLTKCLAQCQLNKSESYYRET